MLKFLTLVLVFLGCGNTECPGEDTSLAPRPVTRKRKMPVCEPPYRDPNCICPSSMFECACHKIGKCKTYKVGCIDLVLVHDLSNNCGDWSDELSDFCPNDKFQCDCFNKCGISSGCISKAKQCDGKNNCGDGSDEINCTCPAAKFECPCFKTGSCRLNGCISKNLISDGIDHCIGWADEVNCTCPAHKFKCPCHNNNSCLALFGGCIENYEMCNGINNCGDWSDEIDCVCPSNKFECECHKTRNCVLHGWIYKTEQCNGKDECSDGSDEINCMCPADMFQCACVKTKQCVGKKLSCIDRSMMCDGKPDCLDKSDEIRCPCDPAKTECPPNSECKSVTLHGGIAVECPISTKEVCSAFIVKTCETCVMGAVLCENEKQMRSFFNFSVIWNCHSLVTSACITDIDQCKKGKFLCTQGRCSNPSEVCNWEVFFCESQQLIPNNNFCDGRTDPATNCGNKSDEIHQGFGFKCSGFSRIGICILPQTNVYDSVAQCSDRSDICFHEGQFRCFQCLDKKLIISSQQVCDGVVDCFDVSYECLCANQWVCYNIRGNCTGNLSRCKDSLECVDQEKVLCNASVHCLDKINTKFCLHATTSSKTFSNEHGTNKKVQDKDVLDLDIRTSCVRLAKIHFQSTLVTIPEFYYTEVCSALCDGLVRDPYGIDGERSCSNMFRCLANGEINIQLNKVCDGIMDCDNRSDEFLELCNSTRYYCKSKQRFSINKNHVCDGIVDCDDKSDESRCRCEATRFYCTNVRPLSVPNKLVQNGINDCSDGSDECVNLARNAFADVNEMIANLFYRGIFWVTGVLSLGGNLFVFVTTTHDLLTADRDQNMFINSSIFILNLCISDFLMGVYLLATIITASTYSGRYCLVDKQWRSSSLCSGLGALAVTSSEASAFTMTSMTTFRLISVYNPFLMRNVAISRTIIFEILCWIMAILLATVPLFSATSEYFVTDVWFPNNFFETDFVSRENMSILAQRVSNSQQSTWNDVRNIIANTFPRNPIRGEFGYYGETSVCMPRLFATSSEFACEYSACLITLNFLLFLYMVVAYLLIYKRSNRMKGSRSNDISSKMQKRITRLILTDFCCWIPICMMGFLSAGGVKMSGDAYVLSACLLLPINSALNPLLYSKALEKRLSKMKKYIGAKLSRRSFERSVRYNPRVELQGGRVIEIVE